MKILINLLFAANILIPALAQAEPVGDVRFMAKIISYTDKWVNVTAGGKALKVPRASIHGDKLVTGGEREVTLSQAEYTAMKNRQLLDDSKKK